MIQAAAARPIVAVVATDDPYPEHASGAPASAYEPPAPVTGDSAELTAITPKGSPA